MVFTAPSSLSADLEDHVRHTRHGMHQPGSISMSSRQARRGRHRIPRRGRHRAPTTLPGAAQSGYAVVVGAAVLGAGAAALNAAAAIPAGSTDMTAPSQSQAPDAPPPSPHLPQLPETPAAGEPEQRETDRAARAASPLTEQAAEADWQSPLDSYELTSGFGIRWGVLHAGADFAAEPGAAVHAASAGTVVEAGWSGGYGNLVVIDHGDGIRTSYAHNSELAVTPGQHVDAGDRIAAVGNTGHSFGPHLHFELHEDGQSVDPIGFFLDHGVDLQSGT